MIAELRERTQLMIFCTESVSMTCGDKLYSNVINRI